MEKEKKYDRTLFDADTIRRAHDAFLRMLGARDGDSERPGYCRFSIAFGPEAWELTNLDEWVADYRKSPTAAHLFHDERDCKFEVHLYEGKTRVAVRAADRAKIEGIFDVFEQAAQRCALPAPPKRVQPPAPPPTIFIGHGRSELWRNVKDHLHEKHGYPVEAYEMGARAGHAIRDVLEAMLGTSAFAILVMTAEDETPSGTFRARQNVVHELGLFQGHLGFKRAIALVEEGVEEFSNLAGVHQLRFAKGNVKETYGEILATLRREFPPGTEGTPRV